MIREQHFSIRAHSYNEDRFVVTDRLFAVIDGATGLFPEKKNGVGTSASRLAAFVKDALKKYRGEDVGEFLLELSRRAYEKGFDEGVSCGIAVVHICGDVARFYTLGDCEIIYRLKDGTASEFCQTELTALDDKAISAMIRIAKEKDISVREAKTYIHDILSNNRAMMNTPDGYNVFSPSPSPSFWVKTGEVALTELQSLYICTDGFAPCFGGIGIFEGIEELFTTSLSVKDICLQIQKIFRQDKDFDRFPRFKLFDDITAIRVDFGE